MFRVQQITTDALQQQTLVLPDGTQMVLTLQYITSQLGWFIQSLVYQDFTLRNVRITTSPNMLRQFKNKLPFGLACYVTGNREPLLQADFSSGNANLFVLTRAEVLEWERFLAGGTG